MVLEQSLGLLNRHSKSVVIGRHEDKDLFVEVRGGHDVRCRDELMRNLGLLHRGS